MTVRACEQVPTCVPSGEQTDCPGLEQELVEGLVDAASVAAGGAMALEGVPMTGAARAIDEGGVEDSAWVLPEEEPGDEPVEEPVSELELELEAPPDAPAQFPTGAMGMYPAFVSTEAPGLGNFKSPPSAVVHPFPILAKNIDGNATVVPRL